MVARTKTTADLSVLRRKKKSAGPLERPGFSIPLGKGFALTERGLAF
jgi:hypothetical protein